MLSFFFSLFFYESYSSRSYEGSGLAHRYVSSWGRRWSQLLAAREDLVAPGTLLGEALVRDWCLADVMSGSAMSLRPPALFPVGWGRYYGFLCKAVRDARKA